MCNTNRKITQAIPVKFCNGRGFASAFVAVLRKIADTW